MKHSDMREEEIMEKCKTMWFKQALWIQKKIHDMKNIYDLHCTHVNNVRYEEYVKNVKNVRYEEYVWIMQRMWDICVCIYITIWIYE